MLLSIKAVGFQLNLEKLEVLICSLNFKAILLKITIVLSFRDMFRSYLTTSSINIIMLQVKAFIYKYNDNKTDVLIKIQ